jgi:pyridoxine/pyridoxamine 5'-phosphate oxidase
MAVAESVDAGTAADEARRVVGANAYMTLATADGDGRPWATPVWFAARDCADFVWVSRPGARHSANIAGRPEVGIVVFDSTVAVGGAAAVYVEAEAEEVGPDDRADALAVFNGRAQEQGVASWSGPDVTGAAQFRLYRARASRVYVLDEHDGRVEVGSQARGR